MLPISFRPEAFDEYLDACQWYEEKSAGLGAEFEACIEEKLVSLRERPELYSVVDRDIREANVRRFPYTIYFRVDERGVRVLSVFHNSRDPAIWLARYEP